MVGPEIFWLFLPIDTAAAACTMEMMAARQPGMQATWSGTLNGSSGDTALFPQPRVLGHAVLQHVRAQDDWGRLWEVWHWAVMHLDGGDGGDLSTMITLYHLRYEEP